jgi:hypothetical protein
MTKQYLKTISSLVTESVLHEGKKLSNAQKIPDKRVTTNQCLFTIDNRENMTRQADKIQPRPYLVNQTTPKATRRRKNEKGS